MLSFVPVCMVLIFGTLLTANGSMKTLNLLAFTGLIINIGFNFYFIPKWGAWGASIATLITQSGVAIFQFIFVIKYFQLKANMNQFFRYTGFILWLILSAIVLSHFEINPLFPFIFSAILSLFIFKMIEWRVLINLLKRNS
jgi:O-antigen/teichoic acid export membrane protein